MGLVFFDFDGTLTTRDTILPLGLFLSRERPHAGFKIANLVFLLILLKCRFLSNHEFKARFCRSFLTDESEEEIERLSLQFIDGPLQGILNQRVLEVLRKHQRQGDRIYLVSSNFAFFLEPLKGRWSLSGVPATNAETTSGRYTGRIEGIACDGPEKLRRVLELFDVDSVMRATAYGDSRSDRYLLEKVDRAVWV